MAHLVGRMEIKAIAQIPGWALEATAAGRITTAAAAYERIPIIRRGVDILADSLTQVPHRVETLAGEPAAALHPRFAGARARPSASWPFAQDLDSMLAATVKAYLLEGAAYWLKLRNRVRT